MTLRIISALNSKARSPCRCARNRHLENHCLRIVAISDTHDLHHDVLVPSGDLLIHAGDLTFFSSNPDKLTDFNQWLGSLPHPHKLVVPGNHDHLLLRAEYRARITNANLLINSGIELGGMRIWGSPVTIHRDGAFSLPNTDEREKQWDLIPSDLDILITHGPPYRVLDTEFGSTRHEGDPQLRAAVIRTKPRLHVFGHVHGGYGTFPTLHTLFANAALPDESFDLTKHPIVFELHPRSEPDQLRTGVGTGREK